MINVLTTDRHARSQLSLLLHDLGEQPHFNDKLHALDNSVDEQSGASIVLLDNRYKLDVSLLKALKTKHPSMKLIGFESFQANATPEKRAHADELDLNIILPSHAERAKARLKSALRQFKTTTSAPHTGLTRPPIAFKRPASKFAAKVASYKKAATPERPSRSARYLTTTSLISLNFLEELRTESKNQTLCILNGEDGAEFELAARELNFQINGDKTQLRVIPADQLSLDELEKAERDASKQKTQLNCYIGRTDDFDESTAIELGLFIEYLENLRNPHMRVILAHAFGSESYFKEGVGEPVNALLRKHSATTIPNLRQRTEDIPVICHKMLAALRSAHPFLMVYSISNEAIEYLISESANLSYAKLIRILRNSMSLCQRSSLCVEDLKNYGESDTTTQHLLESMADEGFFPQSEAANS